MPDLKQTTIFKNPFFLAGGGQMGSILRSKDWSLTPIGETNSWPQSLRTTLGIVLNSKFPMLLCWGSNLICFYNDAFRAILGTEGKHPLIVGMPAKEAWPEIWHIIDPLIKQVLTQGQTVWREDQLIPIFRNGKIENVYWTFSYSPVLDESDGNGGVLVMCSDTTEKITGITNVITTPSSKIKLKDVTEINSQNFFIDSFNESEKKFRNMVLQAPIGIAVLRGENFLVEMANEAYLALVCKKEEDFLGTFLFDSLPEVKESVESLLKYVLTTGISFNAPELAVPLNRFGEIKVGYFNFIYKALKEEDGVISGIIVIVTEVTDMVEARNSLAKDDKLFRNMVMQSPIPMAIFKGRNYIIESANNKMVEDVWRKETKQVLGKQVFEVFPELLRQNFNTIFDEVYDNNKVIKVEEARIYLLGNDGLKKMYLDYVVTPLVDTDGAISGISLTVNEVTKKVEDTQKLEEGEARLRLATEGTKLATWEMDLQTMDVIHSHRFAQILGIDIIKKLTYLEIGDLIDPRDRERVSTAFLDSMATSFYEVEARINWPDKTLHWIKTLGKIFYDENNTPSRLIGTILDITNVKLHEIEMGRLAAIVQTSEDAIISKGLDGIVVTWNDASERMFGYKADEMIGKSISIIIPSNYRDEEASILLKMQEGNRINSFRTQRITKDKRILDISLTISAIKNTAGEIIGISKIARDITKQKLNEIQIAASEAKFKLLANSMAQQIWTCDNEGNLNYVNQAVYDYTALTFEEIKSNLETQIIHADDLNKTRKMWEYAVSKGIDLNIEHRFRRNDGQYRWQLSRAIPQRDSDGKIQMWVGTSTDIHEIKENEQEKDFFISMASHELKTPITSIKGYVQILMSMYKDTEDLFLQTSLNKVHKQIITITTLIGDMLDVSKIKAGSLQLNKENFYIIDLINDIIKEVKLTQPEYLISFTGNANVKIFADKGRIGQVLINLLTNAIKYSPDTKNIIVDGKIIDKQICISVIDSGIGINKMDQLKIFERFYRVAGKDEKIFPGFGIGLFIAAEIVHRHYGKIGVNSEPGKGSMFYFSLPLNEKIQLL